MRSALAILPIALVACTPYSETVGAAVPLGTVWRLETVNDAAASAGMTMLFLASGGVRGSLPCNSYTARQSAPLPWFEIQDISLTRRSCPDIGLEAKYVTLLKSMDHAEIAGEGLLLTNPKEESLFFRKAVPEA